MNGIAAETASTPAGAPAEQPKPAKKPRSAAPKGHVAPSQARSGKQATPPKKTHTGAQSAPSPKKKASGARQGSKTAKVLDLLRRSGGTSLKELRKTTGWQAHSVRGFLSTLGQKMGLTVTSTKAAEGERRYSVKG